MLNSGVTRNAFHARRCLGTAVGDSSLTEDQAKIEVELTGGQKLSVFVEQSLGNIHRPMTNAQIDDMYRAQATLALPEARAEIVLAMCWRIGELDNVGELVQAAAV